jgi:hypothetical protein
VTSYADRYDTVLKDAWFALHDANHLAVAYRRRAIQLTKWKRIRDFINLGMAPSLILLAVVWENTLLRTVLFATSGICSISSWAWVIFGFAFNWDNQLRLSIEIPQKLSLLIPDIDEKIKILYETTSEQEAKQAADKLRMLIRQVKGLRGELEREQVHIKPWMNLILNKIQCKNIRQNVQDVIKTGYLEQTFSIKERRRICLAKLRRSNLKIFVKSVVRNSLIGRVSPLNPNNERITRRIREWQLSPTTLFQV